MPLIESDVEIRLSGGVANADPNASLGGAKSNTQVVDAVLNNLFDDVQPAEAAAGDIEYRCIYVHNGDPLITLENYRWWIAVQTASADTSIEVGLGTSGVNGTEQTIADEDTAPVGVVFSSPPNEAGALIIPDLLPGEHHALWFKYNVNPGAAVLANDNYQMSHKIDWTE